MSDFSIHRKQKLSKGFAVLPLLLIVLLTTAVGGGGYALYKSTNVNRSTDTDIPAVTDLAEDETSIQMEDGAKTTETVVSDGASNAEVEEAEDQKKLPKLSLENYKIETQDNTQRIEQTKTDIENNSNTALAEAQEVIAGLTQDKQNLDLLKATVDEQRNEAIAHASGQMQAWADLAEESAEAVPSNYEGILLLTRDGILSDSQYVQTTVASYFEILDAYFYDSFRKKYAQDVISEDISDLEACVRDWSSSNCDLTLAMVQGADGSYQDDFNKITEKLTEIQYLMLEMISKHVKSAEEDLLATMDRIEAHASVMNDLQRDLNAIVEETNNSTKTFIPDLVRVRCNVSTDDSIFARNRDYTVHCESYVLTKQEQDDLYKAGRVSSGVYIGS